MINEFSDVIIPESPAVLPGEQVFVYIPIATNYNNGTSHFYHLHFAISHDGLVTVKPGAITELLLSDSSVATDKIKDLNVTTEKLADLNVTTEKLANLSITTEKLADLNVTTEKLADLSVNTEKLADNSVTANKLFEDSVRGSANSDERFVNILPGSIGTLDIGLRQIKSSNIGLQEIYGSAIDGKSHIVPESISIYELSDYCVGTSKINDNAITTNKILDGNVSQNKLSNEVVNRLNNFGRAFSEVSYNPDNGKLTFETSEGGKTVVIDLPVEMLVTGGYYDKDTKDIILVLKSGDKILIPLDDISSNLIEHVTEQVEILNSNMKKEHEQIMDSINLVRDSIFEVQIAPPISRMSDAIILTTPTLAVLANI